MVETAIVLSMVLVLLFGIMQIAVWGYTQATTEGAAFVAAHAASVNSSGSAATDATYGLSVANLAFPAVKAGDLNLTYPQSNVIQAIVTRTAGGLLLVPGASKTISVRGGDIEPILANSSNPGSTNGGIAVQATLNNYCFWQNKNKTTCTPRTIYIAQFDDIYGKGNGKNGQFAEWNCRPALFLPYGGTYFKIPMPTGAISGGPYDPGAGSAFGENSLYSFDTSTSKWGTQSSC